MRRIFHGYPSLYQIVMNAMADVRRKLVAVGDVACGAYSRILLAVGINYMGSVAPSTFLFGFTPGSE